MTEDYISLEKRVAVLESLAKGLVGNAPLPSNDAFAKKQAKAAKKEPYKYRLSARSYKRLQGVHPKFRQLAERAIQITPYDFAISEGLRTAERQARLLASGASHVKVSKHQLGLAIDIVIIIDGVANWEFEKYKQVSQAFEQAAKELGIVNLFWGGNWETLRDGPHYQLNNTPAFTEQL